MTLAVVWRSIQHWWRIALPLGLLVSSAVGALIWVKFEPKFRAAAWIRIKERPDYLAFKSDQDNTRFVQNQLELLRGPVVLEKVLALPVVAQMSEIKKAESPMDWLKRQISAKSIGASEFFEISATLPNSAHAATLVNSVLDSYLEVERKESDDRTQRVVELLEIEREKRGRDVETLRSQVRNFAKQVTGADPYAVNPKHETIAIHSARDILEEKLTSIEVDREVQDAKIKALAEAQSAEEIKVPDSMIDSLVEARAEVLKLRDAVDQSRAHLTELESTASPEYQVGVQRQHKEVDAGEDRLKQLRTELRAKVAEELKSTAIAKRKESLDEMRSQEASLQLSEKLYRERLAKTTEGQVQSGDHALELEFAKNELARAESVFERIAERILAIKTEMGAPEQVWAFKRATESKQPEETSPWRNVALACAACFCCPFVIAVVWETTIRRITNSSQLSEESLLPVVGEIAELPTRRLFGGRRAREQLRLNRSIFEESIDSLRTTISLADELRNLKVLALVSSVSGEGKTSLASQLAMSLLKSTGEPVLLIDADMRNPDLHKVFEVDLEPGLAKVLDGTTTLRDAAVRTGESLLHILPAGRLTKSPHALLGCGGLTSLLDEAKLLYRYIIIDTPPVLSASESIVVAKSADAALVCTLKEISRGPQVRMTCERLAATGVYTIGIVLSGVPSDHYTYKYGSYTYSHS
jgi:capsular exopolysaccharide synthesis family protein